jgi:hypothetical protein
VQSCVHQLDERGAVALSHVVSPLPGGDVLGAFLPLEQRRAYAGSQASHPFFVEQLVRPVNS